MGLLWTKVDRSDMVLKLQPRTHVDHIFYAFIYLKGMAELLGKFDPILPDH